MEYDIQNLLKKWKPLLDHEDLPKIRDKSRRATTAILLENQMRDDKERLRRDPTQSLTYLLEAAPTNNIGGGNVATYDPVLISLVRRSMPNLIAYDVCGVQPMALPTGLIFALRSRYNSQTGIEALFNEANTLWSADTNLPSLANTALSATGGGTSWGAVDANNHDPSLIISTGNTAYQVAGAMATSTAETLGDSTTHEIHEMALSIEKISVTAKSRALKAEYTHELAQDLKSVHGLDAETELANILSAEILAEINREIIRSIYLTATFGCASGTVQNSGTFDLDVDSNGRWMVEKFKGLMFQIEREANAIAKATRMGKGNKVICPSDVASAFAMSGFLDYQSAMANEKLDVDDTGNTYAGKLFGRYDVYIDPYFSSSAGAQFVAVGYKGKSAFDAGMFYCPYIPLQMYRAVGQDTFQPKIGFKTRYGLVAHPFATSAADGKIHVNKKNKYWHLFRAINLM